MRALWLLVLITPFLHSVETEEEGLFLRRIADFWQEGEYQIAKSQMEEFIVEYPESPFSDALCAALGDLFLREKNFSTALNYYARVESPEFYQRVFLNRMQCLYEMGWYATLADECEAYLKQGSNLHVTYFLAIGLYHQCINASKETAGLKLLVERTLPYFEDLYQGELRGEVAQGYAHLCCLSKNYQKASAIYLDLAGKNPLLQEEMLFQVALLQSEYDQELAFTTFDQIVKLGQKRACDAAYNRMILAFDLGRYDSLVDGDLLREVSEDRAGTARLFLGRSLLNLKRYDQALVELKAYIQEAPISDNLYAALLSLLDAAFQAGDLPSLDAAISKIQECYPENRELPKAYFSRTQILKKGERIEEAKKQLEDLLAQHPEFEQKPQALFELTHLDYRAKNWTGCYERAKAFLSQFPQHELAPFVWRYAASSSVEMSIHLPQHLPQLILDLKEFLTLSLNEIERNEWELMLAKTYFELNEYELAMQSLEHQKTPNAKLLLALCERDGHRDVPLFCRLSEEALEEGANLVDLGQMHASLYNAYLNLGKIDQSAEHLLQAFMAKVDIKLENLIWLGEHYYAKLLLDEGNFVLAARAAFLLDQCIGELKKQNIFPLELVVAKLAKVYSILGRIDDEISFLEEFSDSGDETKLLLAECYLKKGLVQKASTLFDEILLHTSRSPIHASAALQSAQLKLEEKNPNLAEVAKQLKNLVVQKQFEGEPYYLEAALEYIHLQAPKDVKKRLSLFRKTQEDFTTTEDLLSKDYHAARKQNPEKEKLYHHYMLFLEANILALESKLHSDHKLKQEAEDLLHKLQEEPSLTAALKMRVKKLLNDET